MHLLPVAAVSPREFFLFAFEARMRDMPPSQDMVSMARRAQPNATALSKLNLGGHGDAERPDGGCHHALLRGLQMTYYAHSNPDAAEPGQRLHLLDEHLKMVAGLASGFARPHDLQWAFLAGLWHDLGKYRPAFQVERLGLAGSNAADAHIETSGRHVTHSNAGALHAERILGPAGRVLAYLIAGHHAGLPDWRPPDAQDTTQVSALACLKARMQSDEARREYAEALAESIPADLLAASMTQPMAPPQAAKDGFALWTRMLFSCLVDADFLDTESFFSPEKTRARGNYPGLAQMKPLLDAHLLAISAGAAKHLSLVNARRAEVLDACTNAALGAPGFYTLTVPTGGGKTLSSLKFALDHALAQTQKPKRRVIYAIPYTSIIEQTAKVFADIFAPLGADVVLEHHSNLDVPANQETHSSRLAAENWDAPLIVTTNVQLFESLHAARTSRCRKLHNLIDSVIVLDEAQLLPRDFLDPVLRTLKLLVKHYGVTVVLCTATQPALTSRREYLTGRPLLDGIDNAIEIVGDDAQVQSLYSALERVEVKGLDRLDERVGWDTIADRIAQQDCVLTIVNTRRDALNLYALVGALGGKDDCIHLSALMCAEHRSAVIKDIRVRLQERSSQQAAGKSRRPLRVISTQLVEAGVDLDFPIVFRALAGLDSIAQAAGRCNREGRLERKGVVEVFNPEGARPFGSIKQAISATEDLAQSGGLKDPLSPATFRRYFDGYFSRGDLDVKGIVGLLTPDRVDMGVQFRTAAERFKLIDEDGESVVVPYLPVGAIESPVQTWIGVLAKDPNNRGLRRKLQRYIVNLPRRLFERMVGQNDIEQRAGIWVALASRYDKTTGLQLPDDHGPDGFFP
jgi:CRISPR-associated endonuclease/helicase Cas3